MGSDQIGRSAGQRFGAERECIEASIIETERAGRDGSEKLSSLHECTAEIGAETSAQRLACLLREQVQGKLIELDEAKHRIFEGTPSRREELRTAGSFGDAGRSLLPSRPTRSGSEGRGGLDGSPLTERSSGLPQPCPRLSPFMAHRMILGAPARHSGVARRRLSAASLPDPAPAPGPGPLPPPSPSPGPLPGPGPDPVPTEPPVPPGPIQRHAAPAQPGDTPAARP